MENEKVFSMNWFDVVKQPKLRTSSNITTQLGSESKPEDDDCIRKLREYEIKLKSIRQRWISQANWDRRTEGLNVYVKTNFKYIPEEVACKSLKILNGLNLQETGNKPLSDANVKEQMVVGGKKYEIKAIYSLRRNDKDPLDVLLSMYLKILGENIYGDLRTTLNFTVIFNGTKEEAMKKVDFR